MTPTRPMPLTRDLVLIGGGHTHALLLRRWGMAPLPGARLTLINPDPTAPYTGMLPGHIAGHYDRDALEIDLVRLARHAGARLVLARAEGIDRDAQRIHLPDRPPLAYDLVSLDIGITSDLPELPGFAAHGASAKPLAECAARWRTFCERVAAGQARPEVVVIGGGVAGVELALAMAHRLRALGVRGSVTVLEARPEVLPGIGDGARRALLAHIARFGVALETGARVASLGADAVELADGRRLPAAFTLAATGPRPHPWLAQTGLALNDGFVTVDGYLRSVTDPAIFAVGDCADMRETPRPKAGVFAVRQAPFLHHNLRAALSGGRLRRYRPQRDYLKLVSTGGKGAVADKWGLRLDGGWLWRLKDGIDARFMGKLRDLPAMQSAPLPREIADGVRAEVAGGKPLCAGCGAKMGAEALTGALKALPAPARADLRSGPGDDAAILDHPAGAQVITTDHLRAFTEDPWLMARITAVHALGDVWAMGAAPQAALATVILPRMSAALQARTLSEILSGAGAVFAKAGADIAGGHSAMGAEFTLGFTVTGLAAGRVVTKADARPGDALILTKPLGTGTLLAAEMAHAARGPDIAAAWASMAAPQGAAAALLAPQAHAMTDVTGFGLAGHLMEILDASGAAAELDLAALPLLSGAADCAGAGHASTLAPANRAALAERLGAPETPEAALLVDPQTAGGLLAAVPAGRAEELCAGIRAAGLGATAVIGRIVAGSPRITAA